MHAQYRIIHIFNSSIEAKERSLERLPDSIELAGRMITGCLRAEGKILLCGNGGSAADCQHFAAELTNRFTMDRPSLPAIALTTDSSALTAIGNDYDFTEIFSKQLEALGREDDLLIAISTSGNSANVEQAVTRAQAIGMPVVMLTGNGGGKLARLAEAKDVEICVPATNTARIQEVHLTIIHCLCDFIEYDLFNFTDLP